MRARMFSWSLRSAISTARRASVARFVELAAVRSKPRLPRRGECGRLDDRRVGHVTVEGEALLGVVPAAVVAIEVGELGTAACHRTPGRAPRRACRGSSSHLASSSCSAPARSPASSFAVGGESLGHPRRGPSCSPRRAPGCSLRSDSRASSKRPAIARSADRQRVITASSTRSSRLASRSSSQRRIASPTGIGPTQRPCRERLRDDPAA